MENRDSTQSKTLRTSYSWKVRCRISCYISRLPIQLPSWTEYVKCGNVKYLGTIDFHPLEGSKEYSDKYIQKYLGDQEDRVKDKSKIYDLDTYFSKTLDQTDRQDFYDEYIDKLDLYLRRYQECTKNVKGLPLTSSKRL